MNKLSPYAVKKLWWSKFRSKNIEGRSDRYLDEALYKKLFKEGRSESCVRKQLHLFLKGNKIVYKWEAGYAIKKLREHRLYDLALKLSEAMVKRRMPKTVSDKAIHIDLIAKARGIAAAENYFVDLPDTSKDQKTYWSLLNCYCKELMTQKAEALMEKMKELDLRLSAPPYNSLMNLYEKIGQPGKIQSIIQEMKASDIRLESFSYNIWMRAFAAVNDISGVERVFEELKRDDRFRQTWTTYSTLASIYVDAGMLEKAEWALKELEKINANGDFIAFQFLITLYARTGNLLEVHRVWRSLRLSFPKTTNVSYLIMIEMLVKLKDMSGAEKCFSEWESTCSTYDIRIANVLIGAYAREGSLKKSEILRKRALVRGAKANSKTWKIYVDFHLKNRKFKLAVRCVKRAIDSAHHDGQKWVPRPEVIENLMGHFEQNKDADGAERFVEILKKAVDPVKVEVYESLIRTYAAAGKTSPSLHRQLKMEQVELSEEGKKLLDVVCVE